MTEILYLCIVALFNLAVGYAVAIHLRRGTLLWHLELRRLVGLGSSSGDANTDIQASPQPEPDASNAPPGS